MYIWFAEIGTCELSLFVDDTFTGEEIAVFVFFGIYGLIIKNYDFLTGTPKKFADLR